MKDMFRQPTKLLKAIDVLTEITIHSILSAARNNPIDRVVFPLHKGADGWMSRQQFDTFYWPSLKAIIDALVADGLTVVLFAEGSYHSRLEYVNQFPKGAVCWWFDQTDMAHAKAQLGDKCCIQGNVPASLLVTGDPADVRDYCRRLIETCAPGGGFILGAGCVPEKPKIENLRAMMAAVKEYGG
jgi:uroporphyrinogen-III decarboxylase